MLNLSQLAKQATDLRVLRPEYQRRKPKPGYGLSDFTQYAYTSS